jgi:hypothetical protein
MAEVGVSAIFEAIDRELLIKSVLEKVRPYAVTRLQYDLVGTIAFGLMYGDQRLDDKYIEEPLEEPVCAKIDNFIPKAGQVNSPS